MNLLYSNSLDYERNLMIYNASLKVYNKKVFNICGGYEEMLLIAYNFVIMTVFFKQLKKDFHKSFFFFRNSMVLKTFH